jgi:hypothetical protein
MKGRDILGDLDVDGDRNQNRYSVAVFFVNIVIKDEVFLDQLNVC